MDIICLKDKKVALNSPMGCTRNLKRTDQKIAIDVVTY
jgi:hypothetical protein